MRSIRKMILVALFAPLVSGCVAAAVPAVVGLANLADKSGSMVIILNGSDGPAAFKSAAVRSGCTVPALTTDYARADCADVDVKVEAQALGDGDIRLTSGSLSNVGRTYELEDNISLRAEAIADRMVENGFILVSKDRQKAL